MKKIYFLSILWFAVAAHAQVGVNTTTPNAQLDIRSSNQATPSNTDGILIPKIDTFPATNPTIAQQGMLVYLTTVSGSNPIGFYYWNFPTLSWIPLKGPDGGTLDQAYDFGGAGLGRTITADAGAVTINGNDGLVSNGTFGNGALAPTGAGVKMFWNPRKAAFRAGEIFGTQWNDAFIGRASVAFGESYASGNYAAAFGSGNDSSGEAAFSAGLMNQASGFASTVFGQENTATGNHATSFGNETDANGAASTALGFQTDALGDFALAAGRENVARSFGEAVLGIGATNYAITPNGDTEFNEFNQFDRIFVIGNAIDDNYNTIVDAAERRDAMIVLKSGLTRLPSTTNAMINAADGKAVVTKEWVQTSFDGSLDSAYDFGGAGLGRTVTADTGAVLVSGADGLQVTGTYGLGATLDLAGSGTRMFFNPRKAAFRAGRITGTQWDNANVGNYSIAMGSGTTASGTTSTAFGGGTTASGDASTAFGSNSIASGNASTAFGGNNSASGIAATAFGWNNTASSLGETVLGIGATAYGITVNGDIAFGATNRTDRLFVIGNAIDANSNNIVDAAERSDALIILKNGLTRLPSTTNAMINAADGKAAVTKEWIQTNAGTLDHAYDFGGAGVGRTITADAGAVRVSGEDGLQVTGTLAVGATLDLADAGTRMFFYPRKAAFRAGYVTGTQWNDANIGNLSIAFGNSTQASGDGAVAFGHLSVSSGTYSTAFGSNSTASGTTSTSFGSSTMASGNNSFAFGLGADASGLASTAFGQNSNATGAYATSWGNNTDATGGNSTAWGQGTEASGGNSTAFGHQTIASGHDSTAWGYGTMAEGDHSSAFGVNNTAPSFSETVLGIGATTYTPSANGDTSWGTANATDRLLVVGNSIDTNNNNMVDAAERSDAFVILKNGMTGIGRTPTTNDLEVNGTASKSTAGSWLANSDSRLKKNIQTLDSKDALAKLLALRGVTYEWNDTQTGTERPKGYQLGFIAQEIQQVFPDKVSTDNLGFLQTAYGDYDAVFVQAIKELVNQIEELKAENLSLKAEIDDRQRELSERLDRLERGIK